MDKLDKKLNGVDWLMEKLRGVVGAGPEGWVSCDRHDEACSRSVVDLMRRSGRRLRCIGILMIFTRSIGDQRIEKFVVYSIWLLIRLPFSERFYVTTTVEMTSDHVILTSDDNEN